MQGFPTLVSIADPANGALWTFDVPTNTRFQPISITFVLDVANTSPDRTVGIQYDRSGAIFYQGFSEQTVDDNEVVTFTFDIAGHMHFASGPSHAAAPLAPVILTDVDTISCLVDNINASDSLEDIEMFGYSWLIPQ